MDYSFGLDKISGSYLYKLTTHLEGPVEGLAKGYFSGSGVSKEPLDCQYDFQQK
jgi:hypothetical protein